MNRTVVYGMQAANAAYSYRHAALFRKLPDCGRQPSLYLQTPRIMKITNVKSQERNMKIMNVKTQERNDKSMVSCNSTTRYMGVVS